LIEFKPFLAGPEYVVLDHDRDPTMIPHDESLKMENPWAMKFCEAPALESEGKDSIDDMAVSILKYHKNYACSMPLQIQARFVPRARMRTTTTLRSSLVKSLGGWL
jgi:hypothetical protein